MSVKGNCSRHLQSSDVLTMCTSAEDAICNISVAYGKAVKITEPPIRPKIKIKIKSREKLGRMTNQNSPVDDW